MRFMIDLYGVIAVICRNTTTTVLYVHEEKLRRSPSFAPEIVIGNELVTTSTNQEVINEHSEKQVRKKKRKKDKEKCVEKASGLSDLFYAGCFAEQHKFLQKFIQLILKFQRFQIFNSRLGLCQFSLKAHKELSCQLLVCTQA